MSPPFTAAARCVPSELDAIEDQVREPEAVWSVQVAPEVVEVKMSPPLKYIDAARWVPSELDAIELQYRAPEVVWLVQVAPEFVEVQMSPGPPSTAARWLPSELDAIEDQWREPAVVWSVQAAPEVVEVKMSPPWRSTPTARWVASELDAIEPQFSAPDAVWSVQANPPGEPAFSSCWRSVRRADGGQATRTALVATTRQSVPYPANVHSLCLFPFSTISSATLRLPAGTAGHQARTAPRKG
jgi:hypothetical protein